MLMKLKVLMTRTSGLPKEFLVKCFISGLKKAIKKKKFKLPCFDQAH